MQRLPAKEGRDVKQHVKTHCSFSKQLWEHARLCKTTFKQKHHHHITCFDQGAQDAGKFCATTACHAKQAEQSLPTTCPMKGCNKLHSVSVVLEIRRPESAWHGNILCRIQTMSVEASSKPKSKIQTAPFGAATKRTKTKLIQNPKSKIQTPKSKIQDPRSKIQNPKSKIQNPNSKIQTAPKSKIQTARLEFGFWILDFGFGRAGTGGDGYVANDDVWPCWPPEFGLVGGALACSRKVAGSVPPTRGPNWAPISGGGVLPEIEPRFPAPCRGNRGPISGETAGQAGAAQNVRSTSRGAERVCKCKGCQHHAASTMCAYARDVSIA